MYKYIRTTSYVGLILFLSVTMIYTGITWNNVLGITHPECIDPIPLEENRSPIENWLTTQDGHSIRIWHYPTQNGAVVLVFGDNQGALGRRVPSIETLLYYGFGVIQVDTRACAKPSAPVTLGVNEFFDAEAALKFARSLPNSETHRFGVFGYDMGCTTAIMLTFQNPGCNL